MEEIKAGDIMIGNYIRDRWSEYGFFKVTEIRKDKVFYGNCFKARYEYLVPIPLTEDILLKAGATKIGEKLYKFRHAFIVHETSSCFVIRMESEEGRFWNVMPFSYLHQLQNIYRLCMNQDLKVDL